MTPTLSAIELAEATLVTMLCSHSIKAGTRSVELEAHHMLALSRFSLLQSASSIDLCMGCCSWSFSLLKASQHLFGKACVDHGHGVERFVLSQSASGLLCFCLHEIQAKCSLHVSQIDVTGTSECLFGAKAYPASCFAWI